MTLSSSIDSLTKKITIIPIAIRPPRMLADGETLSYRGNGAGALRELAKTLA